MRPRSAKPHFRAQLAFPCLAALLLSAGCNTGAFPHYPADYREYAYVANAGGSTVSVLNLVALRPETTLQVGPHPVALAASPTRNEIFAVSQGAAAGRGSLAVIDAEANRVVAAVAVGRAPSAVAVDRQGARIYVANSGSNNITILNAATRQVLGTVGAGEAPGAIAVSPDGSTLVVANRRSGSVSVLGLGASANELPVLRASFPGCPGAGSIAILPDSNKAFIACSDGHQVMVVGLRTVPQPRRGEQATPEPDRMLALLDVGQRPVRLVLKPDGGEIFVTNEQADTVSEIATGTNEVGGASLIGSHPAYGVVSADNAMLWVANGQADSVAVYSIDDGKRINTVHVGSGPGALAFSADGHLLLAADVRSGDVSVIRTFSRNFRREPVYGTLFTVLPAGDNPQAIVDKAFRVTR